MTRINNASGVFASLGYNFSDPNGYIEPLSNTSMQYLNAVPPVIEEWQAKDIANHDVGGYFQNPTTTNVNNIITLATNIGTVANTANLDTIVAAAASLDSAAVSFIGHTNRISGVTPWNGDNTVPYYQNATNLGKSALYITNQTDGISNTSPIMGSFTSVLVNPQLGDLAKTLTPYPDLLTNSLVTTTGTDENGNTITTITSNLTENQLNQITTDLNSASNFMQTRQNSDVSFFTNLQNFVNNYAAVRQFSNLGETQTYLVNNFIGSDKLKSRINS